MPTSACCSAIISGVAMGQSTSSWITPSSTDTGKVSTGTYAGKFRGFPVRRSKTRAVARALDGAVVLVDLALEQVAVVVRAAVLDGEQLAAAVEDADLEVLPLDEAVLAGRQLLDGADVDDGAQIVSDLTVGLAV